MHVRVCGSAVVDVRLEIYEPPRFFEAFLRGRRHTEPPDITARICGICPVAYQMSACLAIEAACGIEVTAPIADLRRLLYCGEWIARCNLSRQWLSPVALQAADEAGLGAECRNPYRSITVDRA